MKYELAWLLLFYTSLFCKTLFFFLIILIWTSYKISNYILKFFLHSIWTYFVWESYWQLLRKPPQQYGDSLRHFFSYFFSVISLRIPSELILVFRNFLLESFPEIPLNAASAILLKISFFLILRQSLRRLSVGIS